MRLRAERLTTVEESFDFKIWLWKEFLSKYFTCHLSVTFHQCSTPILIYMDLLEGQTGEVCGHTNGSAVCQK